MSDVPAGFDLAAATARAKRLQFQDTVFKTLALCSALIVLVLLGAIILSLVAGAIPSFEKFGFEFLVDTTWNPAAGPDSPVTFSPEGIYGGLSPIYGTLITSFIALLFAIPLSFGIAVFLTELCPGVLRRPIGIAVELLAGVPSIIYGMFGLFVLAPIMGQDVIPALYNTLGEIPLIGGIFGPPESPAGLGIFTAAVVLAVMIIPYITSITRDVFNTVPAMVKESAYGLGSTTWEVVWKVVLPYTRVGVVGGIMLGLGRALGETMAVTFVVGNAKRISESVLAEGTTISALIANEFNEAADLQLSALIELGLILFIITFLVLAAAKVMLVRMARAAGN